MGDGEGKRAEAARSDRRAGAAGKAQLSTHGKERGPDVTGQMLSQPVVTGVIGFKTRTGRPGVPV